jgi:hypothetical protein
MPMEIEYDDGTVVTVPKMAVWEDLPWVRKPTPKARRP